mmetsp:Transcript_14202/g.42894  ORF Transcript_14202/g.42894 Transcript_14202/m.42894 type:complete len:285 (+) Transcript_14202:496-1350(+)
MADRAFDRLFNEAQAKERAVEEAYLAAQPKVRTAADDEEDLRHEAAPMTAADAIKRTLLAWKDKDYFRLLQLKRPEADALGRPTWAGTPADISRAYRRLSVLVHPDKFSGDEAKQKDAREAFEALNEAHRMMRDPGLYEQILAKEADAARQRRQQREAEATLEERLVLNAQHKEAMEALKKAEGEQFQKVLKRQLEERLQAAERKKKRMAREDADGNPASDDEANDAVAAAVKEAAAKEAAAAAARREAEEESEEAAAAARRKANAAKRRNRGRPPPKPEETAA